MPTFWTPKIMSKKNFRLGIDTESLIILVGVALIIYGVYLDALEKRNAWRQQLFGAALVLAGWKGNTAWVDHVLEDAARTYLRLDAREEIKQESTKENPIGQRSVQQEPAQQEPTQKDL